MPTRIIREGIISSEKVNALSGLAELFYRRLMSVADDYGRFWANPTLLRAACYPQQLDRYTESQVSEWLAECVREKLIVLYGGKYLYFENFGQQTRSKSKFPQPVVNPTLIKCESHDRHLIIPVVGGDGVEDEGGDVAELTHNEQVEVLAKEAHEAFGAKVAFPSGSVRDNVRELLRQGRTPEELRALFSWRLTTKYQFKPQSPATMTQPDQWEKWQGSIKDDQNGTHKNSSTDRRAGTYHEGKPVGEYTAALRRKAGQNVGTVPDVP